MYLIWAMVKQTAVVGILYLIGALILQGVGHESITWWVVACLILWLVCVAEQIIKRVERDKRQKVIQEAQYQQSQDYLNRRDE